MRKHGLSKRLKWRVEAGAHSLAAMALRQLPVESVFVVGEFLGKLIWPLMKGRQKTITRNLRIAAEGDQSMDEIHAMARTSFIRTVANLLCASVSAKASAEDLDEMMEVENPEVLHDALAKGRGLVILLGHMGNWELLTRLHKFFPPDAKLGAFYRPLNNPILNERVLKEREVDGTRLFSKRDNLHQVSGFLRENGAIGILTDQRVGRQGEVAPYFGRLTRVSPLPSLLARRCKSEVVSISLRTVAPGRWVARCHPVERPHNSANCMKAVEEAMKVSMVDVFWLQERWKVYLGVATTPAGWLAKENARSEQPHRALVWAEESERDMELPASCTHGDIEYEFAVGKEVADLREIDESKRLPIDYILLFSKNGPLRQKAGELGIPVFPVSMFSE